MAITSSRTLHRDRSYTKVWAGIRVNWYMEGGGGQGARWRLIKCYFKSCYSDG